MWPQRPGPTTEGHWRGSCFPSGPESRPFRTLKRELLIFSKIMSIIPHLAFIAMILLNQLYAINLLPLQSIIISWWICHSEQRDGFCPFHLRRHSALSMPLPLWSWTFLIYKIVHSRSWVNYYKVLTVSITFKTVIHPALACLFQHQLHPISLRSLGSR